METTLIKGFTALDVLRNDHQSIKELFRQFDSATSDRKKKSVGDDCLHAIETHSMLEEEIFYPAVRRQIGERQRIVQSLAAHQVAKLLIKELRGLPGGEHYNARFNLLRDNIVQHIEEEESMLFPRVERSNVDLEQLALQMYSLKGRVATARYKSIGGRTLVYAAVFGVVAWMVNRFTSRRDV